MSDELRFRPERRPTERSSAPLLALLLVVGTLAVGARLIWPEQAPRGTLVTVTGEVPAPGTYLLPEPTVRAAVAAAGGDPAPFHDAMVPAGHTVRVAGPVAEVLPPADPVLVGLPVDLNTASAVELSAVPGIGQGTAGRIVEDREQRGPFPSVDALVRVKGIGPSTLERVAPFLTVGEPP